ncbi:hypothetical protein FBQ82_01290 [Anaerolineae bacterium CFX7]|nr:hypothetical protein [Anaerolineae bacterium CFX7]
MRTSKTLLIGFGLMLFVGLVLMVLPSAPLPIEEELEAYDQPDKAAEYFRLKRSPRGKTEIPVEKYLMAREHMERMPRFSTTLNRSFPSQAESGASVGDIGTWQSLGPGNIGGRTRALLIHPTNPNIMYAAGVSGGIWRTTNGGASWTPLADFIANINVNSLAMSPTDPNTIFAGTGETYLHLRGLGIFKTIDGGTSWSQLDTTNNENFYYVNDIVISPNNSNHLYAGTGTGIWYSPDGGTSWSQQLAPMVSGGCLDLAIRTDSNTDYLFAACSRNPGASIYRNIDAGGTGTWQVVYTEADMGRTSLALAPSNQNIVYALAESWESNAYRRGLLAVFRSTSSGDPGSWVARVRNIDPAKVNTFLLSNFYCSGGALTRTSNQGWHDNVIAVDPIDSDRVWAGGIRMFRSDDGGKNWGFTGYGIHADQHVIVFHPQYNGTSNQKMFVGNDGGLYLTENARARVPTGDSAFCSGDYGDISWNAVNNNYGVTQFYYGLPHPNGKTYFGGTQDNGTVRGNDVTGANSWSQIYHSDGGYVAIHPNNSNIIYAETQYANNLVKSTNGGTNWISARNGINDYPAFIPPLMMDHQNPEILWFGGTRLWRTTNGAQNWVAASKIIPLDDGWDDWVSAIGIAPSDSNYVLAGSINGGTILHTKTGLSTDGTSEWAAVNPAGGYGFVSSLVFHPTNKNLAYATFSTFGIPHVWKSIDAGATWTNIDGSGATALPDIPVHSIVIDPADTNRLYVGTDLGVFVSLDDGANWAVENTGFANVITESLSLINTGAAYKLFAFTHGRGVFRVTVHGQDPTPTPTPTLTSTPDPNCTTKPAKPTLLKPKNNGSIKKLAVPLDWNDETCTTNFVVVVKQDSKKGTKVDGKTIAVSQYTTKQLAKGKTYFWQVKACNGIGCTKSDWWSFKVK